MSDAPQGPGWWQASDGKWYAPEQASGGQGAVPASGGYGVPVGGTGQLADFGPRAIGYIIDYVIIVAAFLVVFIVGIIFTAVSDALGAIVLLLGYLVVIGLSLYMAYLVGAKGQSPGMAMQGIRCINSETGQPIGGGMGIVRSIITGIIPCALGFLAFFMGDKRQTVGDMVAKSVVVTGAPKASFGPELFKV